MAVDNIEERMAQLDDLNNFIESSEKKITSILSIVGWDINIREKSGDMVICPLKNEHYVPKDNLEKHMDSCSWRMEGYHKQDVPLPECCGPGESCVVIDQEMRTAIIREAASKDPKMNTGIPALGIDDRPIPKTMDRIISDFTPDERRVLYDYAILKTRAVPTVKMEELHMPFQKEEKQRPKTFIERLVEERDAKRRRVSKKVHTNRKSHTEILREVIQNQMELYEDVVKQESEEFRSDNSRRHDDYHYDSGQRQNLGSFRKGECVPGTSKERSRESREEWKRDVHSRSPGASHLKHEDAQRNEEDKWRRRSEHERREGSSSYKDRNSRIYHREDDYKVKDYRSHRKRSHGRSEERDHDKESEEKYRNQDKSNGNDSHTKRKHGDRSSSFGMQSKRRHKESFDTPDSRGFQSKRNCKDRSNSCDSERGRKNRGRSSSYESQDRSQHRERSHSDVFVPSHKDIGLKHDACGFKKKKKSTATFYAEDRKYTPAYEGSHYKSKGGRYEISDDRKLYELDKHYQKVSMKRDGSESRDSQCSDMKSKQQLAAHSPVRKYSWERRNSDFSNDSGSESHRQHRKHKRKKHRKKKHGKREKISPHKSHVSENSSNDFSC